MGRVFGGDASKGVPCTQAARQLLDTLLQAIVSVLLPLPCAAGDDVCCYVRRGMAPTRAPIGSEISNQAGCKPTMLPMSRGWIT